MTTDREALAVVLACRHFNLYLWGIKFTIRTDHKPITVAFRQRTKLPRMNRWILEMRDYHYKVEFKQRKKNVVADQLSRPVRIFREEKTLSWLGRSKEEIRGMQRAEPRWKEMVEFLEGGRIPRSKYPRTTLDQLSLEDEIPYLCKRKVDGAILYLFVVPGELRKDALRFIHEQESGHLGHHKTVMKCEDYFYWPNIRNDVKNYVKSCVTCQQLKTSRGLQQQWQELPPFNQLMEMVSIDITDMRSGTTSHRYVITVIDHFSRFVNFNPMSTRTAERVVSKLDVVIESHGNPRVLLTDNAREFCSDVLRNWWSENGVKLVHSTPYHPQGNSVCECVHRTMKAVLPTLYKGHPARWPWYVKKCQKVINNSIHESTGEQPYFLMFRRRQPRMIGVELLQLVQDADLDMAIEVVKQTKLRQATKWRDRLKWGRQNQRVW